VSDKIESRIVYAVTEGSYSDFGYRAIFELREDAERAQQAGLGDDVHEIRYYPAGASLPTKTEHWSAGCQYDGDEYRTAYSYREEGWTSDLDLPEPGPVQAVDNRWRTGAGGSIHASARTEAEAMKAVQDRVAQLRAERLGL
jgi:hypothetical protein